MASERDVSCAAAQASTSAIIASGILCVTCGSLPVAGRPRVFLGGTFIDFFMILGASLYPKSLTAGRVVPSANLNPLHASIGVGRLVRIVLIDTRVHKRSSGRVRRVLGIDCARKTRDGDDWTAGGEGAIGDGADCAPNGVTLAGWIVCGRLATGGAGRTAAGSAEGDVGVTVPGAK
jgi:hypothetical protein